MTEELRTQLDKSYGRRIFHDFLTQKLMCPGLIDTFDALTDIYLQVNSVVNISALRTVDDIYIKHYLDSLYPIEYIGGEVCDVGCGGGFPCLPLSIATNYNIVGLDSVGKKLILINRCISELHLTNIKAVYSRSEELAKLHKEYDTVTARAVADVKKSLSYCAPLCKPNGNIVLYRTQNDIPAKAAVLDKYKITLNNQIDYVLPQTDIKRRLLIYKKTG